MAVPPNTRVDVPDMVDPMEPPDVVIADTRVIADPDGKVVGIVARGDLVRHLAATD